MPYMGNQPATSFSSVSYQDLTGSNGTSFTLDYPVGNAQEIDVFVNNVRQEPGVAYTANGTELITTGSISISDDFYVVFSGKAQQSATHPANQDLDANNGTFTGTVTANSFSGDGSAITNLVANPSLIINGAMQVWQRTTSVTTSSSGTFSADRWASNAGASTTFSRSTDVPNGFQYSISVAGSAYTGIRTRIEASDCKQIAGQEVTFSWYAKRTAGTGDMKTYLGYASAEDNFGTVTLIEEVVNTPSASVSSDWARYTYTVTLPANAANGIHFVVFNGSASGSVTTLYTGLKLEKGDTATDFIHEDISTTLIKCQRYYFRTDAGGGSKAPTHMTGFIAYTGTNAGQGHVSFPTTMRANPSSTVSSLSLWNGTSIAVTSIVATNNSTTTGTLNLGTGGGLSGSYQLISPSTGTGYVDFDAEL